MLTTEETRQIIEERKKDMLENYGKKAYMLMSEILMLEQSLLNKPKESRLIYLAEWNVYHTRPTISAMRNLIAKRHENGFDEVCQKDGKLWLIDEQKYFKWREQRKEV